MSVLTRLLAVCAVTLLALTPAHADEVLIADGPAPPPLPLADLAARLDVADVELQRLDVPRGAVGRAIVAVALGGQPVLLELEPVDLRGEGFRVLVQQPGGALVEAVIPDPATWRGTVVGVSGSHVAASLVEGRLEADIDLGPGLERWGVQPASDVDPARSVDEHLVYAAAELVDHGGRCGIVPVASGVGDDAVPDPGDGSAAVGGVDLCQVGFEVDYPYYQKLGKSVARCVADVEMVLNLVGDRYLLQTGIQHVITEVIVRADEQSDPYTATSADPLLDQMTAVWNTELSGIQADVGHLFTGRALEGSIIGIAWVGVVCFDPFSYGLSESRYSTNLLHRLELTQHELGHNWSASHCDGDFDCGTMCSAIDSCGNDGAMFGVKSLIDIFGYRAGASCLDAGPPFFGEDITTFLPLGSFNQWRFRPAEGGKAATLARTLPVAGGGEDRRYRLRPPQAANDGGVAIDVSVDELGQLVLHRLGFQRSALAGSPISALTFDEPLSLGGPSTILDQPVQPLVQASGPFGSLRVEASVISIWGRAYGATDAFGSPVDEGDLIDWTFQVVLELQSPQGAVLAEKAVGFKLRLLRDVGPVRVIGAGNVFTLDAAVLREGLVGLEVEPIGDVLHVLGFDLPGVFTLDGTSAGSVAGPDLTVNPLRLTHDLLGGVRVDGDAQVLAPPFGTLPLALQGKGRIRAKTGTAVVTLKGKLALAGAKPITLKAKVELDADATSLPIAYKRGKELEGTLELAITPVAGPAVGLVCEPLVDVSFKAGGSRTLGAEALLTIGSTGYPVAVTEKRKLKKQDGSLLHTFTVVPSGERRKVLTIKAVTPAGGELTVLKISGKLMGLPVKIDPADVTVSTVD